MKVFAITICVNYSDYLESILGNQKHFDRWLVMTVEEDRTTQELCRNAGIEVFTSKCLNADGRDFHAGLNKARVIDEAMAIFESNSQNGSSGLAEFANERWYLVLDADIL